MDLHVSHTLEETTLFRVGGNFFVTVSGNQIIVVYYESIQREVQTKSFCYTGKFIMNRESDRYRVEVVYVVVYYESLKRELKTKPIYEFRCDERLRTKVEESTRLVCTKVVYYEPLK